MKKVFLPILFTLVFFFLIGSTSYTTDKNRSLSSELPVNESVVLVFAGDIMGHMPQIKAAYVAEGDSFNFRPCYKFIKPYIESADLSIANLEVPLAGKPYSGYPYFSSPPALLDGPLWAGFDLFELANNHAADKGTLGISETIRNVSAKAKFVGIYLDSMQREKLYPLLVDIKGVRFAFLNCTYDTNSNPVYKPQIVNLIDTAQIRKDVLKAKVEKADIIVMTIHWGTEYSIKANDQQRRFAQYFAQIGVNLIIGSHPHVVEDFEYVYGKDSTRVPVFYSLGNMISNQSKRNTNGGILARIKINSKTKKIINCTYIPFYVYKGQIEGKFQYYLLPTNNYLAKKLNTQLTNPEDSLLRLFERDTHERLNNLSQFNLLR